MLHLNLNMAIAFHGHDMNNSVSYFFDVESDPKLKKELTDWCIAHKSSITDKQHKYYWLKRITISNELDKVAFKLKFGHIAKEKDA